MNIEEHLLTCLSEECAEVSQRASKALRFGLTEVQPGQPLNNAQRLRQEYTDLKAVFEMLVSRGLISEPSQADIDIKKERVAHYLNESFQLGTLT